jgi:hypothetical protein
VAKVLFTNGHFIAFSTASNSLALNTHIIINLPQLRFSPLKKKFYISWLLIRLLNITNGCVKREQGKFHFIDVIHQHTENRSGSRVIYFACNT